MRLIWRIIKWPAIALALIIAGLVLPILYVEVACRGTADDEAFQPLITDPAFQRVEANTYLTYPEWHIVYAYEGLAEVLKTGDEHAFGYASSIAGFWSSYCHLNHTAQKHGGADFATRRTIYVIGASFTLEMAMKALYEETVGRVFAFLRGNEKTPQDDVSKTVAADYARFLYQTPWYKYDFDKATTDLWAVPVTSARSYERRLALGGEWKAKAAYARLIGQAVQATGVAQLEIKSVVDGLTREQLASIGSVTVEGDLSGSILIKTPRYAAFTKILREIGARGGTIREIAGNDDIMITVVSPVDWSAPADLMEVTRLQRDGFTDERIILSVKIAALLKIMQVIEARGARVEHVYDF
jgi:hypothetical protein